MTKDREYWIWLFDSPESNAGVAYFAQILDMLGNFALVEVYEVDGTKVFPPATVTLRNDQFVFDSLLQCGDFYYDCKYRSVLAQYWNDQEEAERNEYWDEFRTNIGVEPAKHPALTN